MSTTVTLSMETLLVGIPSLVAFSGAVTFVALRGYLVDAVEGHKLLAVNDTRSARWLFLRGYRSTPHAGPDITVMPVEQFDELVATIDEPDDAPKLRALSDRPAVDEDEVGDEQPGEATSGAPAGLWSRMGGWWRAQRSRIRVLCRVRRVVNEPYRGRHWVADVQHTGAWPVVNIPAPRTGDADA